MDIGIDKVVEVFEKRFGETPTQFLLVLIYLGIAALSLTAFFTCLGLAYSVLSRYFDIGSWITTLINALILIFTFLILAIMFKNSARKDIKTLEEILEKGQDILEKAPQAASDAKEYIDTYAKKNLVPIQLLLEKYINLKNDYNFLMTTLKDAQKDPEKLAQFIKKWEKETLPADKRPL